MASVLIVDDDTAMRELLYDRLMRSGYQVITAGSGQQAIEVLKTQRPQIILLDTSISPPVGVGGSIPGRSGLETAAQIRTFDDLVPIVFLQGAGEPELPAETLKQVGIAGVLHKDHSDEAFLSSVMLLLQRLGQSTTASRATLRVGGVVLVVDDEPKIRQLLKSFFELHGLRAVVAESGEEALQLLTTHHPALVLLDLSMPGMDGLITLKKIKAGSARLPVIMVSAIEEEATVREALRAGAYDYVTKPFNLEYLETVVLTKVLLGIEG